MRVLGLLRADADSEAGVPPSPDLLERCGAFMEEISRAGVLLATDGLQPSAKGARVRLEKGKATEECVAWQGHVLAQRPFGVRRAPGAAGNRAQRFIAASSVRVITPV